MKEVLTIPVFDETNAESQAVVVGINNRVGDRIKSGDIILELETDKITLEIPAECSGTLETLTVKGGDQVTQGRVFAEVLVAESETRIAEESLSAEAITQQPSTELDKTAQTPVNVLSRQDDPVNPPAATATDHDRAIANPSARRLARELGIDIGAISGSGKHHRVTKADVKEHVKQQVSRTVGDKTHQQKPRPLPDISEFGASHSEPLSGLARTVCDNMVETWSRVPHAWLQETVDITELESWRQQHKHAVREAGGSLTITVIIAKAVALALKAHPKLNSSYDEISNKLVYKDYIDIGIAVDTPYGLVVPSLRNVAAQGIVDLSQSLKQLSEQSRQRKLSRLDMQGAGLTISNLGGIGLSAIFPIVNWPQVAIIGVAGAETVAKFVDDGVVPCKQLTLTLGFDHRVINGADGARFLVHIKQLLEDTRRMLL